MAAAACLCRDHAVCSRSRSVKVRVVNVTQILIVRVSVHRGHQAVLYATVLWSGATIGARQLVVHDAFETITASSVSTS